jgi:hypothetical protein
MSCIDTHKSCTTATHSACIVLTLLETIAMTYLSNLAWLAIGLLASTQLALARLEVCFNDDPGHFSDPITPIAGPDLIQIIRSLQNNQLTAIGGKQVNDSTLEMGIKTAIIVDFETARVCFQVRSEFVQGLHNTVSNVTMP